MGRTLHDPSPHPPHSLPTHTAPDPPHLPQPQQRVGLPRVQLQQALKHRRRGAGAALCAQRRRPFQQRTLVRCGQQEAAQLGIHTRRQRPRRARRHGRRRCRGGLGGGRRWRAGGLLLLRRPRGQPR